MTLLLNYAWKVAPDTWLARWRGRVSNCTFNCEGAAIAWIATCTNQDRYRY